MFRTTVGVVVGLAVAPVAAQADVMAFTSWEDRSEDAVFGTHGNVESATYNGLKKVSGSYSLKITESSPGGGTPKAVVAWVSGLEAGDTITASVYLRGKQGTGDNAKGRIWGGYYDSTDTSGGFTSAGGPSGYAGANGWEQMTHTWTFDGDPGQVFGLQIRIYSFLFNKHLLADDLEISTSNDSAIIEVAGATSPVVPGPIAGLAMIAGVVGLRRRRR